MLWRFIFRHRLRVARVRQGVTEGYWMKGDYSGINVTLQGHYCKHFLLATMGENPAQAHAQTPRNIHKLGNAVHALSWRIDICILVDHKCVFWCTFLYYLSTVWSLGSSRYWRVLFSNVICVIYSINQQICNCWNCIHCKQREHFILLILAFDAG